MEVCGRMSKVEDSGGCGLPFQIPRAAKVWRTRKPRNRGRGTNSQTDSAKLEVLRAMAFTAQALTLRSNYKSSLNAPSQCYMDVDWASTAEAGKMVID